MAYMQPGNANQINLINWLSASVTTAMKANVWALFRSASLRYVNTMPQKLNTFIDVWKVYQEYGSLGHA